MNSAIAPQNKMAVTTSLIFGMGSLEKYDQFICSFYLPAATPQS